MMTKTAKRKTVMTTVVSPMPMTAMRTGTSAEIGALTKILTHMPRNFPTFASRAITTPRGMPIARASAIPTAKDRKEIETAVLNFAVGTIVIPAASTAEKGGTIVESFAWPISSQTMNQIASEKRIGIFLPNRVMSDHSLDFLWRRKRKPMRRENDRTGVLEKWSGGL